MEIAMQLAAGIICGVFSGVTLGLLRPVAVLGIAAAAAFLAITLATAGVPGVVNAIEHAGARIINFAPFCVAYAAGSLIGRAAAAR